MGIAASEYYLLQPTRMVPRKRIELAIGLTKRLNLPATLVISHSSGDEGSEYEAVLKEYIYEVARRHYSYANLEKFLVAIVGYCVGA